MIIEKKDLGEGLVRVRTQTLDDLWHLEKVLEPGDLLTARTLRKAVIKRGSEIKEGDRVPLTLTITLEKSEFHKDSHSLRLAGPIVSGPEDKVQIGSYHTLSIGIRDSLNIRKEWKPYQLERLRQATVKKKLLLICVLDRDEASFAYLKESGIEHLARIHPRKAKEGDLGGYRQEILGYLKGKEDVEAIVLAGPGFERENLLNLIKQRDKELARKVVIEHTNSTGRAGITELVKSSANRILKDTRIAREAEVMERFLEELQKDGMAAYGRKEVESAVRAGAVEVLLVSEDKVRELESVMNEAERTKGRVAIISGDHEAGERLMHLGGIGALLRYKL